MNTNGGGLSYTHPGMYGMFLIVEAVRQLRGECGAAPGAGRRDRGRPRLGWCCRAWRPSCSARRRRAEPRSWSRRPPTTPRRSGTRPDADELVLQWCHACDRPIWYPRAVCPRCLGDDDRVAGGERPRRRLHGHRRSTIPEPGQRAADGPYVVALIDLDEGVRMMTNVVRLRTRRRLRRHAGARPVASAVRRTEPPAVRAAGAKAAETGPEK